MRWTIFTIVFALFAGELAAKSEPVSDARFAVGQMWTIRNTPASKTRLVIGRVEDEVIHISVLFVPTPSSYPFPVREITIGHMPFDRSAIDASVLELVGTKQPPAADFEAGYKTWKDAKGGRFTMPVRDAIDALFDGVSKGQYETQ